MQEILESRIKEYVSKNIHKEKEPVRISLYILVKNTPNDIPGVGCKVKRTYIRNYARAGDLVNYVLKEKLDQEKFGKYMVYAFIDGRKAYYEMHLRTFMEKVSDFMLKGKMNIVLTELAVIATATIVGLFLVKQFEFTGKYKDLAYIIMFIINSLAYIVMDFTFKKALAVQHAELEAAFKDSEALIREHTDSRSTNKSDNKKDA